MQAVNQYLEQLKSKKKLKIVCMCRGGNVRSVAMKNILNRYQKHTALACGFENNDEETLAFLFGWADLIIPMREDFEAHVPEPFKHKVYVFGIGNDIWGNPFLLELQEKVVAKINDDPYLSNWGQVDKDLHLSTLTKYFEKLQARRAV